jgi:hypothetical protein
MNEDYKFEDEMQKEDVDGKMSLGMRLVGDIRDNIIFHTFISSSSDSSTVGS